MRGGNDTQKKKWTAEAGAKELKKREERRGGDTFLLPQDRKRSGATGT